MPLSRIASRFSRPVRALVVAAAAAGLALAAAAPAVASVPGSLDPTFNPSFGFVYPGGSSPGETGNVLAAGMYPDGSSVFGGDMRCVGWLGGSLCTGAGETARNRIARVNAAGSINDAFNATIPLPGATVGSVAIRPDGKTLAGGAFTTIGGAARNYIALLNPDGTADASFNPNANNGLEAMALQPDGKILIGGAFTNVGGTSRSLTALLNADGTVDPSYAPPTMGRHIGAGTLAVFAVARQADGQVLIGGGFTCAGFNGDSDCTDAGEAVRNRIARLGADGSLDATFNPSLGRPPSLNSSPVEVFAIQPDGKILVGGNFTCVGWTGDTNCTDPDETVRYNLLRLNADGSLDASFNPSIGLNLDSGGSANSPYVRSITLQADGKILVGGQFNCVGWDGDGDCTDAGETVRNRVARLNADGTLDTSFNPSLGLLTYPDWEDASVNSMILQPDGKLVITGFFDCFGWSGDANCTDSSETVRYSAARLLLAAPTAAPTAPTAVAGDARATVSWTAVPGDIASYTVTSSPGGKTCTVNAPATSCVIEGLTNGTAYTFTVKANNAFGEGPTSVASNAVTPAANAEATPKITIPAAAVTQGATLTSTVNPSVGGTVRVTATLAGRTACTVTKKATKAGRMTVTCTLNARTRAIIKRKAVTLKVTARLTDAQGKSATASRNVKVARYVVRTPVTG